MKKKWIMRILCILLAVLLAVLVFGANYLVEFAIARKETTPDIMPESTVASEAQLEMQKNWETVDAMYNRQLGSIQPEVVQIDSVDGLKLTADLYTVHPDSHKWLLGVHGYTGNRTNLRTILAYYAEKGFNGLLPDMRGHGDSEGKYIGMGWPDRKDLLLWIDYILSLDPDAEIILHGISMGGASVMIVSGETLPSNVRAIVEDCGYTSVWDIFSDELKFLFHLPDFPFLYTADLISRIKAGYSFREASALKQVEKAHVPILFIHGSEDNFVHTEMVYKVYDACPAEKDLLVVEGAGHGNSYLLDPDAYFDKVFTFIETYL